MNAQMLEKQFGGRGGATSFLVGRSAAWAAPTAAIVIAKATPSFFI
ncbi:MAG TPA: hypothetical protein VF886_10505 [Roseiarcus sp.]